MKFRFNHLNQSYLICIYIFESKAVIRESPSSIIVLLHHVSCGDRIFCLVCGGEAMYKLERVERVLAPILCI
jgi:hypothetical protein